MLHDLMQEARPPQPLQHQARWPGVELDGCLLIPVLLLPLAEWPDPPRPEIEPVDSPRPKALEPGLDAQPDDSPEKVQRGSWMGCGSWRDLATVVPRRPRGRRLHLHLLVPRLLRLHVHLRLRVQMRLLPKGRILWTRQREEL